jgi:hypothetical protein
MPVMASWRVDPGCAPQARKAAAGSGLGFIRETGSIDSSIGSDA